MVLSAPAQSMERNWPDTSFIVWKHKRDERALKVLALAPCRVHFSLDIHQPQMTPIALRSCAFKYDHVNH